MWVFPLVAARWRSRSRAAREAVRRTPPVLPTPLGDRAPDVRAASLAVAIGALNGWTRLEFEVYWLFGAVLNVPFLAAGELHC